MTASRTCCPWTDEQIAQLLSLNQEGLSASQIARRMQCGISRNAVIGKLMRLGVPLKGAVGRRSERKVVRRVELRLEAARKARPAPRPRPVSSLPDPAAYDRPAVTFAELDAHHCRYPVGDPRQPGFGYCGQDRYPGSSYCDVHTIRCAEAPAVKSRMRPSCAIRASKVLEPA